MNRPSEPSSTTTNLDRWAALLIRQRTLVAIVILVVVTLLLVSSETIPRAAVGLVAGVLAGVAVYVVLQWAATRTRIDVDDAHADQLAQWLTEARARADGLIEARNAERRANRELQERVAALEQQVEDLGEEMEILERAKGEFMARMSHELRTPLNAIVGYSELVLDGIYGDLTDKQRERLERILRNGRGLLGLINDILDLSRIDAGHLELTFANVGVADILRRVTAGVQDAVEEKGLSVSLEVESHILPIYADELRLRQIVSNLVDNAVKFTEEGGVTVDARAVRISPPGDDAYPRLHTGDWLVISVADTGIGIPPELHQEIFGDFTQVDTSATRLHGGGGLGLAITQRLVKMHNGEIWLDSAVGEGTTFSVAVPYTTTRESDVSVGTVEVSGFAHPLVLVVDDAEDSREIIASYLVQAGYGVAHADSGEAALEASRKLQPEVMVLDILMPDVDGWQVLKYLQADPKTADIAVITASIADHQMRAVRRGAIEHIVKPVDRPKLLGAVSRAIVARTRPSILVVDDDPAARDTFTSVLRVAGYPAFPVESVEMAIGWLQERRVGLVLLDFQHSQDDAHKVLDFIQSHPPSTRTPALVIAEDVSDEQLGDRVKVLQKRGLAQQALLDAIGHTLEKYKT